MQVSPCLAYTCRSITDSFPAPVLIRNQFEFRAQRPPLDASKEVDLQANAEQIFTSPHKEIGQNPWNSYILQMFGNDDKK